MRSGIFILVTIKVEISNTCAQKMFLLDRTKGNNLTASIHKIK